MLTRLPSSAFAWPLDTWTGLPPSQSTTSQKSFNTKSGRASFLSCTTDEIARAILSSPKSSIVGVLSVQDLSPPKVWGQEPYSFVFRPSWRITISSSICFHMRATARRNRATDRSTRKIQLDCSFFRSQIPDFVERFYQAPHGAKIRASKPEIWARSD